MTHLRHRMESKNKLAWNSTTEDQWVLISWHSESWSLFVTFPFSLHFVFLLPSGSMPAGQNLFSSVQSLNGVLTLCDPMDCSTPGLPVHHQLLEFTQTHIHWVGDATQPFHPLSSPFPPAFNLYNLNFYSRKSWARFGSASVCCSSL